MFKGKNIILFLIGFCFSLITKANEFSELEKILLNNEINPTLKISVAKKMLHSAAKNNDKEQILLAYKYLGNNYLFLKQYDSALFYYQTGRKLADEKKEIKFSAVFHYNTSIIYLEKNDFSHALSNAQQSLKLEKTIGNWVNIASVLNLMGSIYEKTAQYKESANVLSESLTIMERLGNKEGIIYSSNNLANIYLKTADTLNALNYYENALIYLDSIPEQDRNYNLKFNQTKILNSIGNIYQKKNQLVKANNQFIKALQISNSIGDISALAQTNNNLGNLELTRNNVSKAIFYYNTSLQYLKQSNDELAIAQVLANLGNIIALKNNERAIEYYQEALEIAGRYEKKDLMAQLNYSLYQIYLQKQDFKQALHYAAAQKALEQELYSLESNKIVNNLKIKYNTEKKEKENLILKQKTQRQQLLRNVFILISLLLVVVAFLFYKRYREKHQHNLQISEKNTLLEEQKQVIEAKNRDITESINYAKKIQESLLAHEEILHNNFPNSFIYFQPCSIVSGDFYWIKQQEQYLYVVAADCTGHGVPGAFMSVLGISLLNEITANGMVKSPDKILYHLRNRVKESLHQENTAGSTKDGMDISFCLINLETMQLQFAGAYNSLYFFRNAEFTEYKADRMPISIHPLDNKEFTNYSIQLQKGDSFYIFSDGYVSQFGGPDGGKYKSRRFQEFLEKINNEEFSLQKDLLKNEHFAWRGNLEQVDDMLVIGVRV